ncbi:MAG: hypothetical protein M1838_001636 [Thelocarpon superellum]|nr:MAG: hypothetical protein M1838_001636 [Thelocarpon superellum]
MAPSLSVIALISGGKDSLFSILHCIANGHQVVALANLYPPTPSSTADESQSRVHDSGEARATVDDINSYMYQTVGHTVIPLYEDALGVPLYREPIAGQSINQEKSYHPPADGRDSEAPSDETESLLPLLQRIKRAHPAADAVSTGAILSDYQRTRVESVALRLGLIPLSFLWQYPSLPPGLPASLLDDMAAVGQDARIIKVASGGLDASVLWENVASDRGKRSLQKAMERFGSGHGGAVLGEGGEYETLAVDGPAPLWKKRIDVRPEDRRVIHEGAGSALLRINDAQLVVKRGELSSDDLSPGNRPRPQLDPRIPDLLDADFQRILERPAGPSQTNETCASSTRPSPLGVDTLALWTSQRSTTAWYVSNMVHIEPDVHVGDEIKAIVGRARSLLLSHGSSPDDIVHTTILLRSMEAFQTVNQVYVTLFTQPNPPARLTVALGDALPRDCQVMTSIVVDLMPSQTRRSLHVQSRSYWAPANIGPYSQAILTAPSTEKVDGVTEVASLVYVAGQIPLEPASMEVLAATRADPTTQAGFHLQAILALQHLWRIGRVMEVNWWVGGIAFLVGRPAGNDTQARAATAWEVWSARHLASFEESLAAEEGDSDEIVDIWDQQYGKPYGLPHTAPSQPSHRSLPNLTMVKTRRSTPLIPPFWAVEVFELPRACQVEWSAPGLALGPVSVFEGRDEHLWMNLTLSDGTGRAIVSVTMGDGSEDLDLKRTFARIQSLDVLTGEALFRSTRFQTNHATIYTTCWQKLSLHDEMHSMVVPCRSLWGPKGCRLTAAMVLQGAICPQ